MDGFVAGLVHGQADADLGQNEARAHDAAVELATVAEHLRSIDLDRLTDDERP